MRDVVTLEDVEWAATGRHRFRAVMVMAFAALALVLAMVGVFGVLAYSVQQRVRDFGVRRALGATTGDVLRLVVASAVGWSSPAPSIGLVLSALLGRLIATMLFGVQPLDLATFAVVTIVLALTAARVDRRPGVARGAHRSGGRAAGEVKRVSGRSCGVKSQAPNPSFNALPSPKCQTRVKFEVGGWECVGIWSLELGI